MSYEVRVQELTKEDTLWPDGRSKLIILIDGVEVAEHWDFGEPEDNYFSRNWHWIAGALEQAYQQGLRDAR